MNNQSTCQIILSASEDIYRWIEASPSLQEESITDRLLYEISRQSSGIIHYQHTRQEESQDGADWDWWITDGLRGVAFRVQAKRTRPNHNHRQDIFRSNQNGRQIDLLIASSEKFNLYPLYVLYGHSASSSPCRSLRQTESLFVSPAHDVLSLDAESGRSVQEADLQRIALPMPCLFCCPFSSKPKSPESGPIDVLDRYFGAHKPQGLEDERIINGASAGYHAEIPSIIRDLIGIDQATELARGVFENYREKFAGTQGLLIITTKSVCGSGSG